MACNGIELNGNESYGRAVFSFFKGNTILFWASLVAQKLKNLPVQETWVQSLCWEDPLEEGIATHSSIPAWRISMNRKA